MYHSLYIYIFLHSSLGGLFFSIPGNVFTNVSGVPEPWRGEQLHRAAGYHYVRILPLLRLEFNSQHPSASLMVFRVVI
ncbi:hypothetical protein XELAEV_18023948mg [Xenopus laevis]|uniref:Uncharacterized protein n=1 Tax=Xenopus laevis TaxID=8355 RepID=A0A974D5Y6_XENLA|nr:hypothetical protein XELAEV_18023948mg [Xenopus laevis]